MSSDSNKDMPPPLEYANDEDDERLRAPASRATLLTGQPGGGEVCGGYQCGWDDDDEHREHLCAYASCNAKQEARRAGVKVGWDDDGEFICFLRSNRDIVFMDVPPLMLAGLWDLIKIPVWNPEASQSAATVQAAECGTAPLAGATTDKSP